MASAVAAAEILIFTAIDTAWADATEVCYPNIKFQAPDEPWIRVDVLWGDAFMVSMGTTTNDTGSNQVVGVIQVGVFARKGAAGAATNALVDDVRDMLNRLRLSDALSGIQLGAVSGPTSLQDEEWWSVALRVPFDMFEVSA
jgi:hypothetical protein